MRKAILTFLALAVTVSAMAQIQPKKVGAFVSTSGTAYNFTNGIVTNIQYSVAGTPLPTCNSGLNGTQLQVSDALVPTFLGTYTGSSTVKAPVLCNGTNWVTY